MSIELEVREAFRESSSLKDKGRQDRESRVHALRRDGQTVGVIAERLGLSKRTVLRMLHAQAC